MNVGQAAHLSGQMSGQAAQMNQVPGSGVGVGVGVGGADGLPQHQPMQEMATLSGTDQQFVMLRHAMREKIFEYIGRKQSSPEWRRRLPELAKRLEEILYRKFPNKNEYYNMMKGPVEPQLQFAIKTLSAQNQQNQQNAQMSRQIASSSGYGTMIPTPGMTQGTSASSRIPYATDNNTLSSSGAGMVPQNANMGTSMQGSMSNGYQHLNNSIPQNSATNNIQSTMGSVGVQRQLPHMIPTPGFSNQQNVPANPDYSNGTGYFNGESGVAPHMQHQKQFPSNQNSNQIQHIGGLSNSGIHSSMLDNSSGYGLSDGHMNGGIGVQFAIKTLSALQQQQQQQHSLLLSALNQQNQQNSQMSRQIASSSGYGTMIPTPGMIPQNTNILERIVNGSQEPSALDLALLQSITENFSEKNKIGSGGCGIVYKGILRNGVVAVKRLLNIRTIKDKMFHREVLSLISVKHRNIVRFLGYCSFTEEHVIQSGGRTIMADIRERLLCFEYIRNGSLENYLTDELRGLEWQTRYQIILGICRGLNYLHKDKGIIHMDLKPGNILLDDFMVPKITDFGLSRPNSDSSQATTTLLISQGYVAPEYVSEGKATSKSDIYSLGIIIIELVTGSRTEPNISKVLKRWNHRWIKSMKPSLLCYQQVANCLELALRCRLDVPADRPNISDIINELNEIDSTIDGQTKIQISPCYLEDILGISPLEIHIPFEDFKLSHSIELTNDTDDYIAFVTKAKLDRFCTKPDKGIVAPRSKCIVTLAMQALQVNAVPNKHYNEVITVLSTRVDGAFAATDGDIFVGKGCEVVDEVNVMVVFGRPQISGES